VGHWVGQSSHNSDLFNTCHPRAKPHFDSTKRLQPPSKRDFYNEVCIRKPGVVSFYQKPMNRNIAGDLAFGISGGRRFIRHLRHRRSDSNFCGRLTSSKQQSGCGSGPYMLQINYAK